MRCIRLPMWQFAGGFVVKLSLNERVSETQLCLCTMSLAAMVTSVAPYRVVEGSEWGMWWNQRPGDGKEHHCMWRLRAQTGMKGKMWTMIPVSSLTGHFGCNFDSVCVTWPLCPAHLPKRPAAVTMVTRLALRREWEVDSPNCGYTWHCKKWKARNALYNFCKSTFMKSQNYITYMNVVFNLKDNCFLGLWQYRGSLWGIIWWQNLILVPWWQ